MKHDRQAIQKVGSLRQLAGTRHSILTNGGAGGVRAIDVNTGGGLSYTILPDRGLDISLASFRGLNIAYLSPQEELSASYYNCHKDEWLRTFFAGLLTTCGPVNFGPACTEGNVSYGIHGRFNVTPATSVCDLSDVEQGVIAISGSIANYVLFGEKIEIKRTISSVVGDNVIKIEDTVINHGDEATPNMMLYHINFGYPLLDVNAKIFVNSQSCIGYDEYSQQDIGNVGSFGPPNVTNQEKNYLHLMRQGETGIASIYNDALGFGVQISFDTAELPFLTQWKYERARDYVLALEPSNAPCESLADVRRAGKLPMLEPGSRVIHNVEIAIISQASVP